MVQINKSNMHDFATGEIVLEQMLDQNFEVLRIAFNEMDKVLSDLNLTFLTPVTFEQLKNSNLTFNQLKFGYVNFITAPMKADIELIKSRLTLLENNTTEPGGGGSPGYNVQMVELTATQGQTDFIFGNTYTVGMGQTKVWIDGILQDLGEGYTELTTNSIRIAEPLPAGAIVEIEIRIPITETP